MRLSFSGGLFHASDTRGSNEDRKFAASTSFFEPAVIGEYYFIKNNAENSYLFLKQKQGFITNLFKSLDFYAFTGIGGLAYHVKGNAALVNHGMTTGGFTAVIPVGLGATLIYTPNFNFGVELGGRYSFSDYLDGYTSQYSSSNDVYYFLNFTFTYKLKIGATWFALLQMIMSWISFNEKNYHWLLLFLSSFTRRYPVSVILIMAFLQEFLHTLEILIRTGCYILPFLQAEFFTGIIFIPGSL